MAIILNELEYAHKLLKNEIVSSKPTEALSILSGFYRHKLGYKDAKIYDCLEQYMKTNYSQYVPSKWSRTLQSKVVNSKKYTLSEIDFVPITRSELQTIFDIKTPRMQRLAFSLLCYCKYWNIRNPKNNNWVNQNYKDIFKSAHIIETSKKQTEMLYELRQLSLIGTSKKINNINLQVLFVNDESETILQITDFRELGYEYSSYIGGGFIRCSECGILIKPRSNRMKYCKSCATEINKRNALKAYYTDKNKI